eukprot:scaffold63505_cov28-Tisochrysis_lutea.AAC.2
MGGLAGAGSARTGGDPLGANCRSSAFRRSSIPAKQVLPPPSTTEPYHAAARSLAIAGDSSTPSRSRSRMHSATRRESPHDSTSPFPTRAAGVPLLDAPPFAAADRRIDGSNKGSVSAILVASGTSMLIGTSDALEGAPATQPTAILAASAASASSAPPVTPASTLAACVVSTVPATDPRSKVRGSGSPSCTITAYVQSAPLPSTTPFSLPAA